MPKTHAKHEPPAKNTTQSTASPNSTRAALAAAKDATPPGVRTGSPTAELALFRRALSADRRGDPQLALEHYDAYLATYPIGALAVEAAYLRGRCLVKLGQLDRAAHALAPFAAGQHGGYRRSAAHTLLRNVSR